MSIEIFKEFIFDAAHRLPNVPPHHKCFNLHGHTYKVILYMRGEVGEKTGWVIDFGDVDDLFRPILSQLDHKLLNEVEGLSNPTSEHIIRWIWRKMKPVLPNLSKIVLYETPTAGCAYEGEND